MTDKNRNLLLRVGSALFFLPLLAALFWMGGMPFMGLLAFGGGVVMHEFLSICLPKGEDGPIRWAGVLAAAAMGPLSYLHAGEPVGLATVLGLAMVAVMGTLGWYLFKGPLEQAPARAALVLFGWVYCGGGLAVLGLLRALPDGLTWMCLAVVVTFGNDTGAYFAGRFLGKHKLYVAVSPNKTWEGFFGGMAAAVALMALAKLTLAPLLSWADVFGVGLLGSIFGPTGDLAESMLKRAYGVKDSGNIIPGHGGLLDRIDALVFNGPVLLLWATHAKPLFDR